LFYTKLFYRQNAINSVMRLKPRKRDPPKVVLLGNVGLRHQGEQILSRTSKLANRFSGFKFFGIDKTGIV